MWMSHILRISHMLWISHILSISHTLWISHMVWISHIVDVDIPHILDIPHVVDIPKAGSFVFMWGVAWPVVSVRKMFLTSNQLRVAHPPARCRNDTRDEVDISDQV